MTYSISQLKRRAPKMWQRYQEFAIEWDEANDVCELVDDDAKAIDAEWRGNNKRKKSGCKGCGGLR